MNVSGKKARRLLVTGGAGFIGSNFIRHLHRHFPDVAIINYDKLTYAGNLESLVGIEGNYEFVHGDIRNAGLVRRNLEGVEAVVHFAAETHVDRSILDPGEFILTDVHGTYVLLEAARQSPQLRLFVHVSTDEVYGSIASGSFNEASPLNPSSPYAASKAGGDRLAFSFFKTYGFPVIIVRPCNNYGPYQYPEKLIPFFLTRALEDQSLPLYGDGSNRRDWLFVEDTVAGILALMEKGEAGEVYNMGAAQERTNIEVSRALLRILGKPESRLSFVADRPGHDFRYAVDWTKLKKLGWQPQVDFETGLGKTVDWYLNNQSWWKKLIEKKSFKEHVKITYK